MPLIQLKGVKNFSFPCSVFLTAYVTFELPGEVGEGLLQLHIIKPQGGLDHDVMWTQFQYFMATCHGPMVAVS